MSAQMLDKSYEPHAVEKKWSEYWKNNKQFAAKDSSDQPAYSIVIPPPNVTGVLHMGHALNVTLQDIMCRYRRMKGENVLWMPGTDHAGIATQNVVEKQLVKEGLDRHKLGRDAFIERVWEWRKEYGGAIINQLKRLGASCDWDRERFTMDEGLSKAVRKVFVELYEAGLIYQGNYITNWCPRCQTALADLEVEHEELDGHLYHICYPFEGEDKGLIVATTRPETMLGDTAVAIHPEDDRYTNVPDSVQLPLTGRVIPVIKDSYVDRTFGTGALKVTPAHDPNDFEIGQRHDLPTIRVIGDDAKMTELAGESYQGQDRFECRKKVVADLKKLGLLIKIDPLKHGVGHCYRCKTVVEPNLSRQWFVKAAPLAKQAIKSVENGDTRIIPEVWTKTYYDWMHNIKDWCISRQIWWGHRIPAWYCNECKHLMVSMEDVIKCTKCGSNHLFQESDVLDTWFSSALWPFSTMGWPEETDLLKTFYPTSLLVSGFDILFFWIARMMMMGLWFMKDVPFKDVYIHALVRDEEGKKMSKSKGNVIDPLDIIERYGTDAFRFTLAAFAAQGRDIRLSEKRIEGYRHFINKLWNAARFSLMHLQSYTPNSQDYELIEKRSLADRWILSRLTQVADAVKTHLDAYKFNEAASVLYQFVWHELCDWYLEAIKPILYDREGHKQSTLACLNQVLSSTLGLLHPFIPFITEEIRSKLPEPPNSSLMYTAFPDQINALDTEAEKNMTLIMDMITGIRNIRGEMNISPSLALEVSIHSPDLNARKEIDTYKSLIVNLARLKSIVVQKPSIRPKSAATVVIGDNTLYVSLEGVIDFEKESIRLEKEIQKIDRDLVGLSKKLANEDFLSKAPQSVVDKVKEKHSALMEKREKLSENLIKIQKIGNI
ncbi:valyl-tRNA synthase [Candidatus Magnetomorum sp. HK-1]|nr:valyl-tRNA synthase [Candidatus Magnetomorum sp. HK-1]